MSFANHVGDEALERFILRHSDETELEVVETHILACDACVDRLEAMEIEIAATKLALRRIRQEKAMRSLAAARQTSWRRWFTMTRLSMAGAMAVIALGIMIAPRFEQRNAPVAQLTLTSFRGQEIPTVPANTPVHAVFEASDLPAGALSAKLVDEQGKAAWEGTVQIQQTQASIKLPKIQKPGRYLLQLFSPGNTNQAEEVREFSFEVK
jgi:hypothetical protein